MGKFCTCPCEPCDKIVFKIQRVSDTEPEGQVLKCWSGCLKEMATDADTFSLTFPPKSTLNERMILFATVFFIDFLYILIYL